MYEEMVERLRNNADHYMTVEGAAGLVHLIIDAADAIETLSKQVELEHQSGFADGQIAANRRKPHWIPVTDVLPEKREYVLVRYKNNDMAVAGWFDGDENILFWRAMIDERWCAGCDTEPTHWMPLPPAPEPPLEER